MIRSFIFPFTSPLSLLACLAIHAVAQETVPPKKEVPPPCPQLSINPPGQRVFRDGERLRFNALVTGGDPSANPNYVWTTSSGVVESGQGTPNILVDTTGAGNERQVNVDLWVGGYAPECSLQSRASVKVVPPAARTLEFGELSLEKEADQLAAAIPALQSSPDNIYVFGYAGKTSPRGFANIALKRIKAQLLANGIAYERMAFIDGGYREQPAFEIWIVPVGADAPRPKPTVSAKEIVFPKTPPVTPPKKN